MKRPNVSVEDVEAWTSSAKLKQMRRKEKEQEEARKKKAMSFQQREKRKRDRGQSTRGKSFVEGECYTVC